MEGTPRRWPELEDGVDILVNASNKYEIFLVVLLVLLLVALLVVLLVMLLLVVVVTALEPSWNCCWYYYWVEARQRQSHGHIELCVWPVRECVSS